MKPHSQLPLSNLQSATQKKTKQQTNQTQQTNHPTTITNTNPKPIPSTHRHSKMTCEILVLYWRCGCLCTSALFLCPRAVPFGQICRAPGEGHTLSSRLTLPYDCKNCAYRYNRLCFNNILWDCNHLCRTEAIPRDFRGDMPDPDQLSTVTFLPRCCPGCAELHP